MATVDTDIFTSKEDASNFTGNTGIEIVYPDEYYQTYEDVFEDVAQGDKSLFNDYGQLYKRQGFRKDFDPELTQNYKTKRDYIYQKHKQVHCL